MSVVDDIAKTTLTLTNVVKLIIFLGGISTLFFGLKSEQQNLRSEIKLMIVDYKSEDRFLDLRITAIEKSDTRQENDIKKIGEQIQGILPERTTYKRNK